MFNRMSYRLLTDAEKPKLAEAFPIYKCQDLSAVKMAGAVDANGVRALAVINYVPHCEPVWIEEGAQVDFRRLVRTVEAEVYGPELWFFAPNDKIARMAEIVGARETGWRVFRKELG